MLRNFFFITLLSCVGIPATGLADSSSLSSPLPAQTNPALETAVIDIYDTTMSPYCPGRTLSACPSEKARELRDEVRGWILGGVSRQEVKQRLEQRFGETVRGIPPSHGFGIFSWLMPIVFVSIGMVVVLRILGRMTLLQGVEKIPKKAVNKKEGKGNQGLGIDERIEEELKKRMTEM